VQSHVTVSNTGQHIRYWINNWHIFKPLLEIYQLDLRTPGSSPARDMFLKQILQIPNLRIKARGLPQSGHLLYLRVENFGLRLDFTMSDVLVKTILLTF
jgi:hypothetical protein